MPKKITPAEQAKPTRDEVEAKIKSGFKRLMDRQASPEYRAFVAAVEASKGLTYLDELALKTLVGIERQIPPDTDHPEGIKALECCALAREAKTEMLANYWLRDAVASWKDWMLWDDSIHAEPFIQGRQKGAVSALTTAIVEQLKANPKATAPEVFKALMKSPPRGYEFFDNSQGRYIERWDENGKHETVFSTFTNTVSKQRCLLKSG